MDGIKIRNSLIVAQNLTTPFGLGKADKFLDAARRALWCYYVQRTVQLVITGCDILRAWFNTIQANQLHFTFARTTDT